jgi:diacylglycerol kinase-like protein
MDGMSPDTELRLSAAAGSVLQSRRSLAPAPSFAPAISRGRPALRVGAICGRGYRNLRGDLDRLSGFLNERGLPFHQVRNPHDVRKAIDDFERERIEVLVVSGGDGTVSMAVTDIINRKRNIPYVVVLQGGRTNMTAYDVGLRGDQVESMEDLLHWTENGGPCPFKEVTRPVIGVSAPGELPQCGFFVGGGAIYQGSVKTWAFRDTSRYSLMRTGLGTSVSVMKLVTAHLMSRSAFAPSQVKMVADHRPVDRDSWCLTMTTTLDSLVFGLNPFWGEGRGKLRTTAITHDHKKLVRASVSALRGRTGGLNTEENGYHSFCSDELELELRGGVTLDGQLIHHTGPGLRLGIAGELRFLHR